MDLGQLSQIEKLTERITRLEAIVRENWSKHLDLEARVSELEDQLRGHCINHSTSGH